VDRWSPKRAYLVATLLTLMVGALDWGTGPLLSFSIFYLLPVSLVAWRLGTRIGIVWSVLAALVWASVERAEVPDLPAAFLFWNASVRLGFFVIAAASLAALRRLWETERALAGTDYVTGVLNGRAFHDLVDLERTRLLRYSRPFTLAYIDVDHFKPVNDRLGHSQGDAALRLIATTIRVNLRNMDAVARLGGDEFGVLLPETGPGAAETALTKIRHCLASAMAERDLDLTFSMGAVICVAAPASVDALIHRADELMYQVKESGRDALRCTVLDEDNEVGAILQRS
jgi:diguanylate cyclase (GGDEF)-like protein